MMLNLPAGISIERLQTFCNVVAAGSMAAASNGDSSRQSQYSRQLKELEEGLGTKLFQREGRNLVLTDEGRKFAVIASTFFSSLADFQAASTAQTSVVTLGAGESILRWVVIPRVAEFLASNPAIRVEFRTCRTSAAVRCIRDGTLDLAIIRRDAVEESFQAVSVGVLDYCLVVPRAWLPQKTAAAVSLARELPIVLLSDGLLAAGVLELARKHHYPFSIRARAENFSLLLDLVQNADLGAVLPVPAAQQLSKERFAEVALPGIETLRRDLMLVYQQRNYDVREPVRRLATRLPKLLNQ